VSPVEGPDLFRLSGVKVWIFEDAHACRDPHSRSVNVLLPVIVEIKPACAHTGSGLVHLSFFGNGSKSAVPIIPVEIVTAEVIDHVQIRPAVRVAVAP
jgi:hypothetical protein